MEEKNQLERLLRKIKDIPAKEWNLTQTSCTNQYSTHLEDFKIYVDSDGWISVDSDKGYHLKSFLKEEYKEKIKNVCNKINHNYGIYLDQQNEIKEENEKKENEKRLRESKEEFIRFETFLEQQ